MIRADHWIVRESLKQVIRRLNGVHTTLEAGTFDDAVERTHGTMRDVETAMGSRGLTFAHLCAELLAAQVHGEPVALEAPLAAALNVRRFAPK